MKSMATSESFWSGTLKFKIKSLVHWDNFLHLSLAERRFKHKFKKKFGKNDYWDWKEAYKMKTKTPKIWNNIV